MEDCKEVEVVGVEEVDGVDGLEGVADLGVRTFGVEGFVPKADFGVGVFGEGIGESGEAAFFGIDTVRSFLVRGLLCSGPFSFFISVFTCSRSSGGGSVDSLFTLVNSGFVTVNTSSTFI